MLSTKLAGKVLINHAIFLSYQVHVNLMMLEARLQAELLYSLRAVMRYMT